MAAIAREKTKYPGVFYRTCQRLGGPGEEKVYYIVFKKVGKLIEEKVGRQYADNMTPAKAANIRNERIEGKRASRKEIKEAQKQAATELGSRPTLGSLWEFFRAYRSANTVSEQGLKVDSCNYGLYLKALEGRYIDELTTADVMAMREKLLNAGKSPQTVKHVLGLWRRIIRFGVKNGRCASLDPSKLFFEMPKVDNQRTEFLTQEQLAKVLAALDEEPDQDAAAFIRLALATGMRKGAIIGLRWDDIDFDRGFITLEGAEAKNGKTAQIPMSAATRSILERVRRSASPYVFPGRNGGKRSDFSRMARRIRAKAGLPEDFRPLHGLRHSFASFLASSGQVDLYTLQRLLTHSSPQMTQRYAHLADEAMQRAAAVADKMFDQKSD